jgi:ribosome biogenesis GTPase
MNTGRVLASHGRQVTLESAEGERLSGKVSGRRLQVVCGDEVLWEPRENDADVVVTERLPRRCALTRTDSVGRTETLAANLSRLAVVLAPQPAPDFFIVDRYLAAAELMGIGAVLVLNKADLLDDNGAPALRDALQVFSHIGYPVLECSAATGAGMAALQAQLRDHTTLFAGQSGAGKSSLANRLLPGLNAATAELSRGTDEGRHTTTVSTLHHLPGGGDLIDSPGVRDYAPAIELLGQPAHGFHEFEPLIGQCRFHDCRHLREPGCAVRAAVDSGQISARRYESYRRLVRLSEELAPAPGRKPERRR